jgi:hypothetical protein
MRLERDEPLGFNSTVDHSVVAAQSRRHDDAFLVYFFTIPGSSLGTIRFYMAPTAKAHACDSRIMGAQDSIPYMPKFMTVKVPKPPKTAGASFPPSCTGSKAATAAPSSFEILLRPLLAQSRSTGVYNESPLLITTLISTESTHNAVHQARIGRRHNLH